MGLITNFAEAFNRRIDETVDRITEKVHQIPLYALGLKNIPAVPFELDGLIRTLIGLGKRNAQTQQPANSLSNVYTIAGVTRPAYAFLWGDQESDDGVSEHRGDLSGAARDRLQKKLEHSKTAVGKLLLDKLRDDADPIVEKDAASALTGLSLETPEQFAMSWTTFPDVCGASQHLLPELTRTLTDAEAASRGFWQTISTYGMPYNLILTEKVGAERSAELQAAFGEAWSEEIAAAQAAGLLYVIDLSIFESVAPHAAANGERFCPATITLLRQDAGSKTLEPAAIRVSGQYGAGSRIFARGVATASAWLYALQAAKASIGVYGIWLGHVYHWHIPTAAMQMTMYNTLSEDHDLYQLLEPQSRYLIEFDTLLLLLWENIAPPTPISTARQFVRLEDAFAEGRTFFDDDPHRTLERLGIREADFSSSPETPWDQYRFVGDLLQIWEITGRYVDSVVAALYPTDDAVADDEALQKWMKESTDPHEGNIRGLPAMNRRDDLRAVLQSFLYRITAHGSSRLLDAANPGLSFVANFPPCLQRLDIPDPQSEMDTRELLTYLPKTGTIGEYMTFFNIFSFSVPYEPLVPIDGIDEDVFFAGDTPAERTCNDALVTFREEIVEFMRGYQNGNPQVTQWARNVET